MSYSEILKNVVNNGKIKPKSRNDKNDLNMLRLKKESNTISSIIRHELKLYQQNKVKSRNINNKERKLISSSLSKFIFQKNPNEKNSFTNTNEEELIKSSIKRKIELLLPVGDIVSRNIIKRKLNFKNLDELENLEKHIEDKSEENLKAIDNLLNNIFSNKQLKILTRNRNYVKRKDSTKQKNLSHSFSNFISKDHQLLKANEERLNPFYKEEQKKILPLSTKNVEKK